MRKIQFRVWDNLEKKYVHELDDYHINHKGDILLYNSKCIDDRYTIEQSTGLHDKNGKEIYEGDIIGLKGDIKTQFEVVFHNGGFCYKIEDEYYSFSGHNWLDDIVSKWEVIGNVNKNKNLLEEE
jgi:uncharacterized phage protein (TIGR01671 family)